MQDARFQEFQSMNLVREWEFSAQTIIFLTGNTFQIITLKFPITSPINATKLQISYWPVFVIVKKNLYFFRGQERPLSKNPKISPLKTLPRCLTYLLSLCEKIPNINTMKTEYPVKPHPCIYIFLGEKRLSVSMTDLSMKLRLKLALNS